MGHGYSPAHHGSDGTGTPVGITAVKKGSRTLKTGLLKVANKMEAATGVSLHQGSEGSSGTPSGAAAVAAAAVKRAVGTPSIMAEEQLQGNACIPCILYCDFFANAFPISVCRLKISLFDLLLETLRIKHLTEFFVADFELEAECIKLLVELV